MGKGPGVRDRVTLVETMGIVGAIGLSPPSTAT